MESEIRLSILIPSIPSRFERAIKLYNKIMKEIEGMEGIEVLMFTDNKKRTIGEKRNALKNISNGKYFLFVDDDDDIENINLLYDATLNDVDVITYKSKCRNVDGSDFIVTFGLGNEVEHNKNEKDMYLDCKRPPWHNAAWNRRFKHFDFAPVNYGEDWEFVKQCIEIAKTEYFIDAIVHRYNFDLNITEADTSSNEYWKNPNEIK